MPHKPGIRAAVLAVTMILSAVITSDLRAQSGSGYDLSWSTVDGGGGESSGGVYAVVGTIGQAETGVMSGGSYTLRSGFWPGAAVEYKVYLPLTLQND
jgi:hypothetical protein